jgi:autotransporter translocation and assembly factor TamB
LDYQQTFGALPEWRVDLRYRIDKRWSVQTGSNSKGATGIDLFWERRY